MSGPEHRASAEQSGASIAPRTDVVNLLAADMVSRNSSIVVGRDARGNVFRLRVRDRRDETEPASEEPRGVAGGQMDGAADVLGVTKPGVTRPEHGGSAERTEGRA